MLRLQPLQRAAVTSCTLMAIGDAACQAIQLKREKRPIRIDLARSARFGLIGLTLHGPFFFKGFQLLDARFGTAATFKTAATKSLAGQVTLFPTYTTLVLLYAALLEGHNLEHAWQRVTDKLPKLFITGSVYWPTVNLVNFRYVPAAQRVLALNVCAIAWNAYLSYINAAPISQAKGAAGS